MIDCRSANKNLDIYPLLNLIERRFAISVDGPLDHLKEVNRHYSQKREFILAQFGEADGLIREDYAKAVLISEASRLMILREIKPRPRKKKRKE